MENYSWILIIIFTHHLYNIIIMYTQEAASAIAMETEAGSTHDLECSHSERSIDEAIEKSSGTLSPTSPIPIMEDGET